MKLENSLCARDAVGQPIRDSNGYPIQECMCGNIIHERFDQSKSFFTNTGNIINIKLLFGFKIFYSGLPFVPKQFFI